MKITTIDKSCRSAALVARLVQLWGGSVRTTHHFLTPGDIERLKPCVEQGLMEIPVLGIAVPDEGGSDDASCAAGFIGLDGEKIEMLFVASGVIGKHIGRQLVDWAVAEHGARLIDVNEQNAHAATVYRHWGFETYERTETDDYGNPFPILKMRRV